jgi:hypothetical protein
MGGKLELAGSINYLKAEVQDSLFARLLLHTDKRTQTEYLGEGIIQESVGRSRHYDTEATHVVTKISYGASAVRTLNCLPVSLLHVTCDLRHRSMVAMSPSQPATWVDG